MGAPNQLDRISAVCYAGKHERCTGQIATPDLNSRNEGGATLIMACECTDCEHEPIPVRRYVGNEKIPGALAIYGNTAVFPVDPNAPRRPHGLG